jgi:dihydrofolate reductase
MFGGGPGPWAAEPWHGRWGDDPPFQNPVFVLTHPPRPPLAGVGGTTITFVTEGVEEAREQARAAAGAGVVSLAGGAATGRQFLEADLVDEMEIDLVPAFLGAGERLLDGLGVGRPSLVPAQTIAGPGVTHMRFVRSGAVS